ncbi:hypothetical protein ACIRPX_43670 [Streptomyces sp. NPDC101225]|uniref:hypothetical protein n=1 Tax=Streptomyces sp. NPDC101225 TaxID=3366135 RepID=UPI00382D6D6E
MSQAWTVYVELAARDTADSIIEELCERLADCDPAVGVAPNGNLSARVWVDTGTARQAIDVALKEVTAAAKALGIDQTVIGVELLTEGELDRRNAEPIVPDLGGVSEIAEMLGVGRQRAAQLTQRDDFPSPVAQLKAGPVFFKSQVRGFEARWDRHGGRPIKPVKLTDTERRLLEYLAKAAAATDSEPIRGWLTETPEDDSAHLTVVWHKGSLQARYASHLEAVRDSLRKLSRERLVSVAVQGETDEETVVDLALTSKGERVAAMH